MKFFFDNNLSPYLAKSIAALCAPHGHDAIHKTERFARNTDDVDWMTELAAEGDWVVISHDRFAKNSLEKEALRSSGLITFILKKGWSDLPEWEKAWKLIRWWPRILNQCELVSNGAFLVPPNFSGKGKFEQVKL